MKDYSQRDDTLNNKELEGSATENLNCLYLCTGYFAQQNNFTTFIVNLFCMACLTKLGGSPLIVVHCLKFLETQKL